MKTFIAEKTSNTQTTLISLHREIRIRHSDMFILSVIPCQSCWEPLVSQTIIVAFHSVIQPHSDESWSKCYSHLNNQEEMYINLWRSLQVSSLEVSSLFSVLYSVFVLSIYFQSDRPAIASTELPEKENCLSVISQKLFWY